LSYTYRNFQPRLYIEILKQIFGYSFLFYFLSKGPAGSAGYNGAPGKDGLPGAPGVPGKDGKPGAPSYAGKNSLTIKSV
jgi:hypothetical protein